MTDPLPTPAEPATKKPKQWPWVVGAIIVAGVVIAIRVDNDPQPTRTTDTASSSQPQQNRPVAAVTDPYTTDGTYLVGTEIAPGTYRTQRAQNANIAIWRRCSSIDCAPQNLEGGHQRSTILSMNSVETQGYLVIEPTDVAVELSGLVLTPAN